MAYSNVNLSCGCVAMILEKDELDGTLSFHIPGIEAVLTMTRPDFVLLHTILGQFIDAISDNQDAIAF